MNGFFTDLSALPATSGGTIFRCTFFTNRSTKPTTSGGTIFRCTFFTYRSTLPTVSDGPIFRCTTKDRGERRASSSQAPHPSFCLSGQKLSRSAAPPLPTEPTSLGFGGGPVPKPPFGILLLYGGLGGETCERPTDSPKCNLRDLGPPGGVPVVFTFAAMPESQAPPFFGNSLPKALLPPDSIVLHVMQRNCWNFKNNQLNL